MRGGEHCMTFCSPVSNVLIIPRAGHRVLLSNCEILDGSLRTLSYILSKILSKIDSMQNLNGRGEIRIDDVRALLLVHNMTLSCHVQLKPLWDYLKVSITCAIFPSLSTPISQEWRQMFGAFDYNRDGIVDSFGLSDALRHYGCVVFLLR